MDLCHRPTGGDVLHRDGRCSINLTRAIAGLCQFIGQSHREAAGVSGCNQLGRIGAAPLIVAAGGVGRFPEDSAWCADRPFATPTCAHPQD